MLALGAFITLGDGNAEASSHREAPFITKNPKVDGTDFYMFRSYEPGREGFVTLIANYLPLQDAYGGPNYFALDPEALYEIHIDNNADAIEDLTFQFRFSNALASNGTGITLNIGPDGGKPIAVPQLNLGPLDGGAGQALNVNETYGVQLVRGERRSSAGMALTHGSDAVFTKPTDYIGSKSFPGGYGNYANQYKYSNVTVPGCAVAGSRLFVGQRKEPFVVNLGTIFDLVNAPPGVITNIANRGALNAANPLANKNVTTIALEIPIACLTAAGADGGAGDTVIGAWTTASVRQARVINPNATYATPAREGGAWAQVSRLGHPLINEVIVGLKDKDKWNSSEPKDDAANFLDYVTNPSLPVILETLFGSASVVAPTLYPRADLVAVFLTGVPGVTKPTTPNARPSEQLRLNTALPPTAAGPAQNPLGAAQCFPNTRLATNTSNRDAGGGTTAVNTGAEGCDPAGFPNGRRPKDDVVDIALTVAMGYLLPSTVAPNSGVVFHDAMAQESIAFDAVFPYLTNPTAGAL
jgi:hypothetical protein